MSRARWEPDRDDNHPTDELTRYLLATHQHEAHHDATDDWVVLHTSAVFVDCMGPAVEVGPWSMSADEARLLATSLLLHADLLDREVTR